MSLDNQTGEKQNLNLVKSFESIPLDLNDTEICVDTDEETETISREINSFNISACGKLKFNRCSNSALSTVQESQVVGSNYCTNNASLETQFKNLNKYKRYNISKPPAHL